MNNCICGKEPKVITNQPPDTKIFDGTERFRVMCKPCNITTSFYRTMDRAELAWDNKGWLNRRRAA